MQTEKIIPVDPQQSIFTSHYFTCWPELFKAGGLPAPKYNGTEDDLVYFLKGMSWLLQASFVGVVSLMGPHEFPVDGTTMALGKVSYWLLVNRKKVHHYFPTEELFNALEATDIQWVDVDHWKRLPDSLTIHVPKKMALQCNIMGTQFSVDDIALTRVKTDLERAHHSLLQGVEVTDQSEIWFWVTQSRGELDKNLQNTTFGSLIVDHHTKLSDLLEHLVDYASRMDQSLMKEVESKHLIEHIDELQRTHPSVMGKEHAEYVKGMFSDRYVREQENYKYYRANLEFILKFVTYMGTDQFKEVPMPIPGVKPGKTSSKAKAIHERLFDRFGLRFKVSLPKLDPSQPSSEHHKSPTRHLVRGFFRQQPYGQGRLLRKTIWILPFWRGSVEI